jgi:CRISPR system Cascade subunit CasE
MSEVNSRVAVMQGFMSKVTIPLSVHNARYFHSPYEQHRSLWRIFNNDAKRSFLFRELNASSGHLKTRTFLIASEHRPTQVEGFNIATREYVPRIQTGDCLEFSIRVAVTSSVNIPLLEGEARARGQKVDPIAAAMHGKISPAERQRLKRMWLFESDNQSTGEKLSPLLISSWLAPRFEKHGVAINMDNAFISSYQPASMQGTKNNGAQRIRFSVAEISGEVKVIEPSLVVNAIFQGIGRGKSLGCGMLLIRRSTDRHRYATNHCHDDDEELA